MRSEYKEWAAQYNESQPISFYNGAIAAWNHRQTKVDELQKRVDAVKQLIQVYKDEEKELELKEWEQSTIYGRIAIELEQALKGEQYEEHRKKAEAAISNGASLTSHRIEL